MALKSKPYIGRGWPPERRKAQAERMRRTKPWLKATGPKTQAGKARVRLNAQKHGLCSAAYRAQLSLTRALLRMAAQKVRTYKAQAMAALPLAYWEAHSFPTRLRI